MATDFEAEGLLEGLEGEDARKARLELLRRLSDDGVELDELKSAVEEGRVVLLPVERALSAGERRYTLEEVVEEAGMERPLVVRLWRALGMPEPESDAPVFDEEDLASLKDAGRFLDAGIPEDEFLSLTRTMSQALSGVAASIGTAFAGAFLREGDTEAKLALRYAEGTRELLPLLDQTVVRMLHLHLRERSRSAVIGEAELASGSLPGSQRVAVCFADLVGFTKLGERLPSEELGSVAGRLAELAGEVAESPVRMVKTIGDAAMLVAPAPEQLLRSTFDLLDAVERAGQDFPRLRVGASWGPALNRSGDWYGRTVNLASRITDVAEPGTVIATRELSEATAQLCAWSPLGAREFKGIADAVELFQADR